METSTTVVTGASRGFGRALATALVERGRHVVGVARDAHDLAEVRARLGALFDPVAADATDPDLPDGCSGSIARARSCWLPAPCRRCGLCTC